MWSKFWRGLLHECNECNFKKLLLISRNILNTILREIEGLFDKNETVL